MTITRQIQNLKCGGCTSTIVTKLSNLVGISNVQVNIEASEVTFECLKETDILIVHQKLRGLGYPFLQDENSLEQKAKSNVSYIVGEIKTNQL